MTREEAIEYFKMKVSAREAIGNDIGTDYEAYKIALSALRPVSREQVERMRGEWIGDNDERVETIDGSPTKSATCSACGNWLIGSDEYPCAGHFCPSCGAPMTDEAVQMVMERMEKLYETI